MKKIMTLVLAAVMLIVCLVPISSIAPKADSTSNAPTSSAEQYIETHNGATIENSTLQDGKATFTVVVPDGAWIQFMQKLSITDNKDTSLKATVTVGDHSEAAYKKTKFYMQLTPSDDLSTDIVRVKEGAGEVPGTDGMTWNFYGNDSNLYLGLGSSTKSTFDATAGTISGKAAGPCLIFTEAESGKVVPYAPNINATTKLLDGYTSYRTVSAITNDNKVYFRLRGNTNDYTTYHVTLESPDIKSDVEFYDATDYIKHSDGALLDKDSVSIVDGSATFKIKLPANGFAQFDQKLTDLIGGGATVNIKIGNNGDADYTGANVQAQLTADADAKTDIVPVDERSVDPGVEGMTWLFYGNSQRLWTGRGSTTAGGGTYSKPATDVPGKDGINIVFNLNDDGKVSYASTDTLNAFNNNLSSTKTLAQIGGTNGVYFRLRSVIEQTYTVTIKSADIKKNVIKETNNRYQNNFISEIEQNVKLSTGSSLDVKNSSLIDGMVTFKVTLPADGYAQFNQRLTDLIGGGATVNIKIGKNQDADYLSANVEAQLTANSDIGTDISPVNENSADPGVAGMTWLFYGSSPRLWTGRGNSPNSGGTYSNPATDVPGKGGINIVFNLDDDGKVSYASTDTLNGFNNNLASTKTLAEIGGTSGVYFRLRSEIAQTYTVTIKSDDIKKKHIYDYSDLFECGVVSGKTNKAYVYDDSIVVENGRVTFKANVPDYTYVQFMQKLPITDDVASTMKVSVKVGVHDASTYNTKTKFRMQLTSSADITNHFTSEPSGLTWNFYAATSKLAYDIGTTTRYTYDTGANIAATNVGPTLHFMKTAENKVLPVAPNVEGGVTELPSTSTLSEIGGDDGLYFRLYSNTGGSTDAYSNYTVTIESPYIKVCDFNLYNDASDFLKVSDGVSVYEDATSIVDGKATFKVELPANGYAQFMQKVAISENSENTLKATVTVADNSANVYKSSDTLNFNMQLTSRDDVSTDIDPTNETNGVSWIFYGSSGYAAIGLGNAANSTYCNNFTTIVNQKGINIEFHKNQSGTVSPKASCNASMTDKPTASTLTDIGGDDGVYFRLRSRCTQTYIVTLESPDIKAPIVDKDRYSFSDDESYLISSSHNVENGVVTDEFTFKLNGAGSNIQLDEKIATLIDGGFAKVYLGDNKSADYAATNFSMQLTSKPDELLSDPVDEGNYQTDPRTITFSFGMAGDRMAVNKGANATGGGSSTYIPNYVNTPGVDGINLYFKTNKTTGTLDVSRVSPLNGYDFLKSSSHTIADADLTDGAYFRLRHAGSTPQVYTVVLTYPESNVEQDLSSKAYIVTGDSVVNADNADESYAKGATITKVGHYVETSKVNNGTVTKNIYLYRKGDINADNSTNVLDAYIAAKYKRYADLSDVGALGIKAIDEFNNREAYPKLRKELLGIDYEVNEYKDYIPVTLNVEDFGAVGDGVTDDGVAIFDALQALRQSAPGSVLEFEAKTYRFVDNGKYGQLTGGKKLNQAVFEFYGDKGLTIRGKTENGNTTLISIGGTSDYYKNYYANIQNSEDIAFENINFDYAEYKSAFVVENVNYSSGFSSGVLTGYLVKDANGKYPDIHLNNNDVYNANGDATFGVLDKEDNRYHMFFKSFKMVNKDTGKIEITLDLDRITKDKILTAFLSNPRLILPMPYSGNLIQRGFTVHDVNNFTMKDCKVFSASRHGMSLQGNTGNISFINVDVVPSDDKLNFTSWGDFYHVLNSTGANYYWKDCEAKYNYDDVFNISASTLALNKINSSREIEIGESKNGFSKPYAGNTLVIVDHVTGELIYRDTIKRVLEQDDNSATIRLSSSISTDLTLENLYVWIEDAVGTSTFENCTFDGTFRARGNTTFKGCNLTVKRFWIGLDNGDREGPLSRNILFDKCAFNCQGTFDIGSYNNGTNATASNAYKLENIKFSGCTSISSSNIVMKGNSADQVIFE